MSLFVKGAGFFNDAYDLFVMSNVNVILKEQYPDEYTASMQSLVSTAVLIGAVIGQITFGYFADIVGRRRTMIVSCSLLIIGGILSAAAYGPTPTSLLYFLALWRFVLGIGIGAEYPLSATSTAEGAADEVSRGPDVALTFSLQGWGSLTASICANLLVQVFANAPPYTDSNLECIWRILFAIGAMPAIGIFYWRLKAEESESFLAHQEEMKNAGNKRRLKLRFILKHYGKQLIGTAGNWFLFDVVFYGQSLFSATVLRIVGIDSSQETLQVVTLKNVFLAIVALPGYLVAVMLINRLGRKFIQMQGYFFMALIFLVMGIFWDFFSTQSILFVVMYALTYFFSNFGPNVTTFVIPTETFPTAIRASCHGISAASGKIGASVGSSMFAPLEEAIGVEWIFIICGIISLLGIILTVFFTSSRVVPLEELEEEFRKVLGKEDPETRASFQDMLAPEKLNGINDITPGLEYGNMNTDKSAIAEKAAQL